MPLVKGVVIFFVCLTAKVANILRMTKSEDLKKTKAPVEGAFLLDDSDSNRE